MSTITRLFLLLSVSSIASASSLGALLTGDWESAGVKERRILSLDENGSGQFVSDHPSGICIAPLKVQIEGQFVRADGTAEDCQQKGNPVRFEFFCQQVGVAALRCKIKSLHVPSGNAKQGVETFTRKESFRLRNWSLEPIQGDLKD